MDDLMFELIRCLRDIAVVILLRKGGSRMSERKRKRICKGKSASVRKSGVMKGGFKYVPTNKVDKVAVRQGECPDDPGILHLCCELCLSIGQALNVISKGNQRGLMLSTELPNKKEKFKNYKLSFDTGDQIEVTRFKIHDMLGIPVGGYSLFKLDERETGDEFVKEWADQFSPIALKKIRVNDIARKLVESQEIYFFLS
ncbi:hypothetical protein Tco_0215671 [Tanacetum coccineum]